MVDPDQFSLPDNLMIDLMKLMIYSNGFLSITRVYRERLQFRMIY